jgi:hypothetical protein
MIRKVSRLLVVFVFALAFNAPAQEPNLTVEQMKNFLLTAKVIKNKQISKGVTAPYRLTLTDGTITHDASFQSVDEKKLNMQFRDGRTEMNFVDSYKYNIAAYEIAALIGMDNMMPVTVERKWNGKTGAVSWWLPVKMDEEARLKSKITPPDVDAWNNQMYKMRLFAELVYDTDRNLGNVLISDDWKLYMIDFTRAFRLFADLKEPKNLTKCEKQVLEKLKGLTEENVVAATKRYLTKAEAKAVLNRRDKIVTLFEKLGPDVLY